MSNVNLRYADIYRFSYSKRGKNVKNPNRRKQSFTRSSNLRFFLKKEVKIVCTVWTKCISDE